MRIIAIGASTGGPTAIDMILMRLPAVIPVPIIIFQHLPARFTASMAARLNSQHDQDISEITDGETIRNGHVYIAPGDHNLFLETPGPKASLIKVLRF